ncbi:PadR family transcriptional regulator [Candidatus Gracilibacteria bacterium]|nr:PadR family transcriptional regulator [Candidatus Gracilibacteria bacterium]
MSPMVKLPLSLEYALLGFVRERPSYAYEIHQQLERTPVLHLIWRMKQRQTYALLERLEVEGCLASATVAQGRRPPRRMLRLTEQGMVAFQDWLALPVEHGRDFRQEFMAKLFFAQREGQVTLTVLIARQRTACAAWLAEFQTQLSALPSKEPLDKLVIQFRIGQLDAILTWLDQCEAVLHSE